MHEGNADNQAAGPEPEPDLAAWYKRELDTRGLGPSEMARRLGPPYKRDIVSLWASGKSGMSPAASSRNAKALEIPLSEVLERAGHRELADHVRQETSGKPAPPPRDEALARLYAAGLPPAIVNKLASEYQQALASAARRLDLEVAEALRKAAKPLGRRARAHAAAEAWLAYLAGAIADTNEATGQHLAIADFVDLSGGDLAQGELDTWQSGPPTAIAARLAAHIIIGYRHAHGVSVAPEDFETETATALRAAGYDSAADEVEQRLAAGRARDVVDTNGRAS